MLSKLLFCEEFIKLSDIVKLKKSLRWGNIGTLRLSKNSVFCHPPAWPGDPERIENTGFPPPREWRLYVDMVVFRQAPLPIFLEEGKNWNWGQPLIRDIISSFSDSHCLDNLLSAFSSRISLLCRHTSSLPLYLKALYISAGGTKPNKQACHE